MSIVWIIKTQLSKCFLTELNSVKFNEGPTFRFSYLQQYLCKLKERQEISEEIYQRMRPQNRRLARAHDLPKIYQEFVNLPKFWPIVFTARTVHYHVGKHLSELFNPLACNEYTIKDSFDVVTRLKNIPQELFDLVYRFLSFDVVSLLTNVPLQKAINILLKSVYVERGINTLIRKNTMRKLIKDTCQKPDFVIDNEMHQQIDSVSMGSPLAPVLANIIMTELESTTAKSYLILGK